MLDEIEPLGVDDVPDCLALAQDRGWAPRERLWRLLLEEGRGFGVRDEDGDLVGTVILTWHGPELASVGMMLVATRYGQRGVGRRLMENALAEAGDATVFLYATSQGRPLYEKLDFSPIGTSHTHQGVFEPAPADDHSRSGTASETEMNGVREASPDDRERIPSLDTEVFGGDRGRLLRRLPYFGERLLVVDAGEPFPDAADTADTADAADVGRRQRSHHAVAGFASSWNGTDVTVVGPVIAGTVEHAKRLIGELASKTTREVRVDLDERHPQLRSWAVEHGLVRQASTTVMVRGARSLPGDRSRYFAPWGPALG